MRSAYEEGRLLWNRKPISEELARPDLPVGMREKLRTVLEVRRYARDKLGLEVGGAYNTVSEVDRGAIIHLVMAAPKDSLRPYTWWFPIVGSVPYRGYFDKTEASAEAAALRAEGLDTLVRPAVAFSTLGFFDDPVLSNLLKLNRVQLAAVVIHELFHRTFFLPGQVMFNESAANYIGSRGAVDFFVSTEGKSSPEARLARRILSSQMTFGSFLLHAQARLLRIYVSDLSRAEVLRRRKRAFRAIKAEYAKLAPSLSGLERFDLDKRPLNNAVLINYLIYFHDLGNFAALDRMNHCHLKQTISQIIELAESNPYDPFYAVWEATRRAPGKPAEQGWAEFACQGTPSKPAITAARDSSHPAKK